MVKQVEFKFCPLCGGGIKKASNWIENGKIFETRWLCEKECEVGGLDMVILKNVVSEDEWESWLEWEWNPYQSTVQSFEN